MYELWAAAEGIPNEDVEFRTTSTTGRTPRLAQMLKAEVETALGDHPGDGGVVLVDRDSWSPCADFGKSVLRLLPATETYAVALSAKPALGEATVADLSVAAATSPQHTNRPPALVAVIAHT